MLLNVYWFELNDFGHLSENGSVFRAQTCNCKKGSDSAQRMSGSSAQYLSCKMFRDWSIIKLQEINRIY